MNLKIKRKNGRKKQTKAEIRRKTERNRSNQETGKEKKTPILTRVHVLS